MVDELECKLNEEGYLPKKRFEVTLDEFKNLFVFTENQDERKKLYKKYESFYKKFGHIIIKIWINGSYTTGKLKPGDIDVAVHYDAIQFQDLKKININDRIIFKDRRRAKKLYSIDLLPVPVYPLNHPYYPITKIQEEKWNKLFLRDTRVNPHIEKGYVEIVDEV